MTNKITGFICKPDESCGVDINGQEHDINDWQLDFIKLYHEGFTMDEMMDFIGSVVVTEREEFKRMITKEIAQSHLDGEKTSRLTSLYNKIK